MRNPNVSALVAEAVQVAVTLPPVERELVRKLAQALRQSAEQNEAMREAIAFATAPDMWIQREDDIYKYRYREWYANRLKQVLRMSDEKA